MAAHGSHLMKKPDEQAGDEITPGRGSPVFI
jgi:hypothetical protein